MGVAFKNRDIVLVAVTIKSRKFFAYTRLTIVEIEGESAYRIANNLSSLKIYSIPRLTSLICLALINGRD